MFQKRRHMPLSWILIELSKQLPRPCIPTNLKACVHYFLSNFYFFHWMTALKKLWKMFIILSKKLFSYSRYSKFCNFFPSFAHFPDWKGQMEVEQFMMSWFGLHKYADVIFGITQKLLYITSSNLVR